MSFWTKIRGPLIGGLATAFGGPLLGSALGISSGAGSALAGLAGGLVSPGTAGTEGSPDFVGPPSSGGGRLDLPGKAPAVGAIPSWMQGLGTLGSAGLSYLGQRSTNASNAAQAQQQMDFQEQMSSSSWQRGVKDMQAAGLSPMLAYSQGGASSPGGAQASMVNAMGEGVGSALQAASTLQSIDNGRAQRHLTEAQELQTDAQTQLTSAQARMYDALTGAQIADLGASARQKDSMTENLKAQLDGAIADSRVKLGSVEADIERRKADSKYSVYSLDEAKSSSQFYKSLGQASPWLRMLLEVVNSARRFGR